MSAYWLVALAILPFIGCDGDGGTARAGGDCTAVGAKLVALGQDRLEGLESEHESVMRAQLQLANDQFVEACRKNEWPAAVRACFLSAEDAASFDACAGRLKTRGSSATASE